MDAILNLACAARSTILACISAFSQGGVHGECLQATTQAFGPIVSESHQHSNKLPRCSSGCRVRDRRAGQLAWQAQASKSRAQSPEAQNSIATTHAAPSQGTTCRDLSRRPAGGRGCLTNLMAGQSLFQPSRQAKFRQVANEGCWTYTVPNTH